LVRPYKNVDSGKKVQVEEMFDHIAPRYDFLNHFLSMGIDRIWRKKAIRLLKPLAPHTILDLATGTGDLAIAAIRLNPSKITGVDLSEKMLEHGRRKIRKLNLSDVIELIKGDSEKIPFPDRTFDAVTVAFGVRNFETPQKGINEMFRVLKPDGSVVVLEFSHPKKFPVKQLYHFYFFKILPTLGRIFSKDHSAYFYLPESVKEFPYGESFLQLLENAGFSCLMAKPLSFGIAHIYFGKKEIHNKPDKD